MKLFVLFSLCFVSFFSFSQDKVAYKTNVELGVGVNYFLGDICNDCASLGPSLEVSSRFLLGNKFFFRPEFYFNRFMSSGSTEEVQFKNNSLGLNLSIEYGLHKLTPAMFTGRANREVFVSGHIGALHSNPFTAYEDQKVFLAPLQTEEVTFSKLVPLLGGGINFNFKVQKTNRVGLRLDLSYAFSDYIDNVSKGVEPEEVSVDEEQIFVEKIKNADRTNFSIDSRNDLFLRAILTYEFQIKTKHSAIVSF